MDTQSTNAVLIAFLEAHGGKPGWVMARLGMRFHSPSAADARRRILASFAEHLAPPASAPPDVKGEIMQTIRLHPHRDGVLTFDLKQILAALRPNSLSLYWVVGDVPSASGTLDVTGEGSDALEHLAASRERVSDDCLAQIAEDVHQVIWGQFEGYDNLQTATPYVIVAAIDSSFWEIRTADHRLLDQVAERFDHVDRL